MADINIQRKKNAPSPWLLVLLALAALAVGAYFFLRPEPADEPAPAAEAGAAGAAADTTAIQAAAAPDSLASAGGVASLPADSAGRLPTARRAYAPAPETAAPLSATDAAAALATQAATSAAAPDYARRGLQQLTEVLVALTDRDDLRDAATTEQRDNLTSATDRLAEPQASLRPGFVAAAGLIRALQRKAYPELEGPATDLVQLAGQLSGRSATAAEQQQNQQFFTQAAAAVRVLSEPAP